MTAIHSPAITVRGLRKAYGALEAVRGIDVDVAEGEVFGFLGPNGAGKTTTRTAAPGVNGGDLAVLGAWTVVGAVLALRLFKWENER